MADAFSMFDDVNLIGQTFLATSTGSLITARMLVNSLATTGTVTAEIFDTAAGLPTGPALATDTVVVDDIPEATGFNTTFDFSAAGPHAERRHDLRHRPPRRSRRCPRSRRRNDCWKQPITTEQPSQGPAF